MNPSIVTVTEISHHIIYKSIEMSMQLLSDFPIISFFFPKETDDFYT